MLGISCPEDGCDWHHEEVLAEVMFPEAFKAFADPAALAEIMRTQRLERISAAVLKHYRAQHPDLLEKLH